MEETKSITGSRTSPIRDEVRFVAENSNARVSMEPAEGDEEKGVEDNIKADEKKGRVVGALELFRYASTLDILMMVFGIAAAIVHGTCLIFVLIVFTNTLDDFGVFSATIFCEGNIIVNCTNRSAAVDGLIDDVNHPTILYFCITGVVAIVTGWIQVTLFQISAGRQIKRIRVLFFRAVLKQEIAWFDLNATGELNSRLNDDLEKVAVGIGDKLAFIFQAISTFITGVVVAFIFLWQLALLIVGCAPIVVVVGGIAQRVVAKLTVDEQAQYAGAGAVTEEVIGSIRTVIVYGGQEKEVQRYAGCLKEAKKSGVKKAVLSGASIAVNYLILFGVSGLAYWFCAWLISNVSGVTISDVLVTFFSAIVAAQVLGQAGPNFQDFSAARGSAGVLFDVIDREPELTNSKPDEGIKPEKFVSDVRLADVDFYYPARPEVQVLEQFSVKANPGQTLALVGASGCGKSTVVQLVQRFYDVSGGKVQVGGYDVKELNLQWLRQQIGVVSQEPVLFATTIAENIRFGKEGVTQAEIEEAAKAANAHSFISDLPDGYDTLVGERGTQLSGGQKQRVAIARALVRDPKILLLDEATSALDTESEAQVQAALDKARQGRTTIVIAHRLSTIQGADIIAAITNGRVVEIGTHSQLLQRKGVYFDLVTAQSYGEEGDFNEEIVAEMIHKYTKQASIPEETKKDVQISRQFSRQQSIPEASSAVTAKESTKEEEAENEEELKELARSYSVPSILWRSVMLNMPELIFILFGLLFATFSGLVLPAYAVFFGEVIDDYTNAVTAERNARVWAGLIAALGASSAFVIFLRSWVFSLSGEALTARLREHSFKHILRQDMGWFDQTKNSTGKLTTRLSHDAAQVQGAIGIRLGLLIEIVVTILASLIIALYYSWSMTLLILAFLPLVAITQAFQGRVQTGATASSKKGYEESSNIAYEAIINVRTVASLSLEERMGNLFEAKLSAPHKKSMYDALFYGFMVGFSDGLVFFMYAVVFRFGAFVVTLDPDHAAFTTFKSFLITLLAIVMAGVQSGQISVFLPNYSKAILSARRIFQLLDTPPVIDSYSTEGLRPEIVNGNLEAEHVYFTYPSRPTIPVLQGLSFTIKCGQTLAFVGPSGCGKSTVVSLLERLYNPDKGVLKFDGENLKSLNIQWLRNQIGLVSQEPVLFGTTIADNIRYGANFRQVSDEEVEKAAKAANIHNFIETLPQGYNTNVGTQGTQLSGGQKQRVAIARALIRDPKILLLDEATSALDTESEKVVQEALDSARKGRTSVMIAHRLSTIHNADCIAVIKDGVVIEAGNHNQLMDYKGAYYKLNKAQMLIKE